MHAAGLLNVYPPGDGVSAHTDDPLTWTGWVLGLSLGSDTVMTFRDPRRPRGDGGEPPGGNLVADVLLPRRSLYVMTGEARWGLTHEIVRRQYDYVRGVAQFRDTRVSMTLRGINPEMMPLGERARDDREAKRRRAAQQQLQAQEQQQQAAAAVADDASRQQVMPSKDEE